MKFDLCGVLPFISFKEKVIQLADFLIFCDSKVDEIAQLSENARSELKVFAHSQKNFIANTFQNFDSEITFVLPINPSITMENVDDFFEILFFYLHKGKKFTYFFSTPNSFCQEDFKHFILQTPHSGKMGQFVVKKKFKAGKKIRPF